MASNRDFEAVNAQKWELDTDVGSIPPSRVVRAPNSDLSQPTHRQVDIAHQVTTSSQQGTYNYAQVLREPLGLLSSNNIKDQIQGSSRNHEQKEGPLPLRRLPIRQSAAKSSTKEKPGWAKLGLVTTRKLVDDDNKATKEAEKKRYLNQPEPNDIFPSTGYFLWPQISEPPTELLGLKLEDLNNVRTELKVYIDWDDDTKCLRIRSNSASGNTILDAIQAINLEVQNAKTRAISALPVYIVVPPTEKAIRGIVSPVFSSQDDTQPRGTVVAFRLSGPELTEQELNTWRISERPALLRINRQRIQEQLIKTALGLSVYRGWMRMRVHFGHLHLKQYRKDFTQSTYSFKDFVKMMKEPRTTGTFERRIADASIATYVMQKFEKLPGLFSPAESRMQELKDMKPVHSEVIFVTTRGGQNLRVEADLDTRLDESGNETVEYQTGTIRLYHNNQRNKRFETTTVDIENHLDWNLDIITDNSIHDIPSSIRTMIETSLPKTTIQRVDSLGLTYPRVCPRALSNDLLINEVVVRSVWRYRVKETGYEIQVSIYRVWSACPTDGDPEMSCGITVSHPVWDEQMQYIDDTTQERRWGEQLENFFPTKFGGGDGFDALLDEIAFIQGYICEAAGNVAEIPSA
ncbi:hypothetical protein F5884DRAFT_857939 [Xylogone sp. PMI_703]|nr:hypothetical protein F5884DRAFT_857939 [Xylogone sp. PMI_703]